MNPPPQTRTKRKRSNQRRKQQAKRNTPAKLWREPAPLPAVEPIAVPHEVGALHRSLGDPPMYNGAAAGHYFSTVIERSAAVAVALALSADLLADDSLD